MLYPVAAAQEVALTYVTCGSDEATGRKRSTLAKISFCIVLLNPGQGIAGITSCVESPIEQVACLETSLNANYLIASFTL